MLWLGSLIFFAPHYHALVLNFVVPLYQFCSAYFYAINVHHPRHVQRRRPHTDQPTPLCTSQFRFTSPFLLTSCDSTAIRRLCLQSPFFVDSSL